MSCDRTTTDLGAYALGTLDPAGRREVERHLDSCISCRAELAELESVVPALAMLSPADVNAQGPSADLFDRVVARVDDRVPETVDPQPPHRLSRWLVAAAAVLVLAGSGTAIGVAVSQSTSRSAVTAASGSAGGVRLGVRASDTAAGTRLELTARGLPEREHCHLVAVARDGSTHDAGSWTADYDGSATLVERTDVPRSRIARFELYGNDGRLLVAAPT